MFVQKCKSIFIQQKMLHGELKKKTATTTNERTSQNKKPRDVVWIFGIGYIVNLNIL